MKKGISLIVLVITIIIIIILAGAVILNLADNNPIENANAAAVLSEQSDLNDAITMYLGAEAADAGAAYRIVRVSATDKMEKATLTDANGKEIGEGYYDVRHYNVTINGETVEGFHADPTTLLEKVGMKNPRYAGVSYRILMNDSGNVKLVENSQVSVY